MRNFMPPPRRKPAAELLPLTVTCLEHGYAPDTLDAIALAFSRAAAQLREIGEAGNA